MIFPFLLIAGFALFLIRLAVQQHRLDRACSYVSAMIVIYARRPRVERFGQILSHVEELEAKGADVIPLYLALERASPETAAAGYIIRGTALAAVGKALRQFEAQSAEAQRAVQGLIDAMEETKRRVYARCVETNERARWEALTTDPNTVNLPGIIRR